MELPNDMLKELSWKMAPEDSDFFRCCRHLRDTIKPSGKTMHAIIKFCFEQGIYSPITLEIDTRWGSIKIRTIIGPFGRHMSTIWLRGIKLFTFSNLTLTGGIYKGNIGQILQNRYVYVFFVVPIIQRSYRVICGTPGSALKDIMVDRVPVRYYDISYNLRRSLIKEHLKHKISFPSLSFTDGVTTPEMDFTTWTNLIFN